VESVRGQEAVLEEQGRFRLDHQELAGSGFTTHRRLTLGSLLLSIYIIYLAIFLLI